MGKYFTLIASLIALFLIVTHPAAVVGTIDSLGTFGLSTVKTLQGR